jgi:hypothetical protein
MKTSRTLLRAGFFLILLANTGCIPGITWLPDSSGFIYTTYSRNLIHFDVAKGKERTIVDDTETGTFWPGVSPDGKQVAVARLTHEKGKPDILQVIIYDMNGKVVQRSSAFTYSEAGVANDKDKPGIANLFWSPQDNKIIIDTYGGSGKFKCGIYDVKADRISFVLGAHPAAFGGNPCRPDGKGFLVAKIGDKDLTGMAFIDRQGNEHAIAMEPPEVPSKQQMLAWPFIVTSSWDGNKAIVFDSKGRFEIDTDKYIGKFTSSAQAQPRNDTDILPQFAFPNSSKVLRVLEITKQNREKFRRLEVFDTQEKKAKTLIGKGDCILFPSPNRKLVAVRCFKAETKEGKQSDLILVINQQGEIVAQAAKDK